MPDDADAQLSSFVNILGITIFSLIVFYHFLSATPDDARA